MLIGGFTYVEASFLIEFVGKRFRDSIDYVVGVGSNRWWYSCGGWRARRTLLSGKSLGFL